MSAAEKVPPAWRFRARRRAAASFPISRTRSRWVCAHRLFTSATCRRFCAYHFLHSTRNLFELRFLHRRTPSLCCLRCARYHRRIPCRNSSRCCLLHRAALLRFFLRLSGFVIQRRQYLRRHTLHQESRPPGPPRERLKCRGVASFRRRHLLHGLRGETMIDLASPCSM